MGQIVICYDPENRIEMRHDRLPARASHVSMVIDEMPTEPEKLEQLARTLAALLLKALPQ